VSAATATKTTTDRTAGAGITPHWKVAVIGAGAGGLGLAIRLVKSGRRDFVLFEATDGVGGTWRVNTYPGAACDVPSHLYSYSFALKPDWTKTYANQPEILQYFEDCAERFDIRRHLRPQTRITSARWDDGRRRWTLRDDAGNSYEADVLVSAIGTFATPFVPFIGPRRVRRAVLPLGALGTPARPQRTSDRRHRHRSELGADRARVGEDGRAGRRLSAHAAVDPAPT